MRLHAIVVFLGCVVCACGRDVAPPPGLVAREECLGKADGMLCTPQGEALRCRRGEVVEGDDCFARGQLCLANQGCALCKPGSSSCDGAERLECSADGMAYEFREACTWPASCSEAGCVDLCERAQRERSYIGCEYFPVFTVNSELDAKFEPAIVVANPNLVAAEIVVTRGEERVGTWQVAPLGVTTIRLPFVAALRTSKSSRIVRRGAYHVVSSVPVTVHQFNPLLFEINEDCARDERQTGAGEPGDQKCNSFSNDASLLAPAHALIRDPEQTLRYLTVARPSMWLRPPSLANPLEPEPPQTRPGFVAIVGASEAPVHVTIHTTAYTLGTQAVADAGVVLASDAAAEVDAGGLASSVEALAALSPGETSQRITLQQGDVVQLLSAAPDTCSSAEVATAIPGETVCELGPTYDLTGTLIEADGPVEVIAGHDCAFVPFDRRACDHLEETMFPLDTWGVRAIVPKVREGVAQPQRVRVVSGADDNLVTFTPALHEPVTLMRGAFVEFEANDNLLVRAQKPISVAHFLTGQDATKRVGDPSQSLAIPVEQYRSEYAFLSPASYALSFVTIIARGGDSVLLDGNAVGEFVPLVESEFQVATVRLTRAGVHTVQSQLGLGIGVVLYGFGDYTSYMLPGGLDLRVLPALF